MMKYAVKFSMILAFFSLSFFTSCDKNTDVQDVEAFVDNALLRVAESASTGADGCYELVLPVSVLFSDGTTAEVSSIEDMKEAFRTWKENNPDATRKDHPELVLPVDFISEDGVITTVSTKEELRALRVACGFRGHGPKRGKRGNKECSCFELVFPITILFPDDSTAEITDRADFKMTIREWKENNPDATERPELVFPISVELEDGTIEVANSMEDLKALKLECREGK